MKEPKKTAKKKQLQVNQDKVSTKEISCEQKNSQCITYQSTVLDFGHKHE